MARTLIRLGGLVELVLRSAILPESLRVKLELEHDALAVCYRGPWPGTGELLVGLDQGELEHEDLEDLDEAELDEAELAAEEFVWGAPLRWHDVTLPSGPWCELGEALAICYRTQKGEGEGDTDWEHPWEGELPRVYQGAGGFKVAPVRISERGIL